MHNNKTGAIEISTFKLMWEEEIFTRLGQWDAGDSVLGFPTESPYFTKVKMPLTEAVQAPIVEMMECENNSVLQTLKCGRSAGEKAALLLGADGALGALCKPSSGLL